MSNNDARDAGPRGDTKAGVVGTGTHVEVEGAERLQW